MHVEIATEQKRKFELHKCINYEATPVEIAKEQKSGFELRSSRIPVTRSPTNLQETDQKNAESSRNTPKATGTWKHYSGRKISRYFPATSHHFLLENHRKLIAMHRKQSRNFPAGILLLCSDHFPRIPAGTAPYSFTRLRKFINLEGTYVEIATEQAWITQMYKFRKHLC